MTKVFPLYVFSLLILSGVEPCFIPGALYVQSPKTIPAGHQITRVEAVGCDPRTLRFTVEDPRFTIQSNGVIVALRPVPVATRGRTLYVRARDNSGPGSEMEVHLVRSAKEETNKNGQLILKRTKRRWSPPPLNILENDVGKFPKDLQEVVSDSEANYSVYYTVEGFGVDQYPFNVFSVDRESGLLRVHKPVDREEFPKFVLRFNAFDKNTNLPRDLPLDLEIVIDDVNDNKPEFQGTLEFTVPEHTLGEVGKVNATDRDDPNSDHVRIKYTLKDGLDNFAINGLTGVITTVSNKLDRETKDTHKVTIEIRDLKGAPQGLFNTATATITLKDINDNPPTFTQQSYKVTVPENEGEKLLLRIPVEDKDLVNTPNWISKFVITKGNENGNFRIDTDPKTNEGLLYVTKPLDYEKSSNVKLEISAQNQEKLTGTTANWLSIPVDVAVTDIDEGPEFLSPTIRIKVKENLPNGTSIGTYKAVDPETKSSNGIMYYKVTDPGSWLKLDRNTGELTVTNTIDRESPLVQNGEYNITVRAVDATSKSGTGTVILMIEDMNDNMPTIPEKLTICEQNNKDLSSVVVPVDDNDLTPYSAPFSYSMPDDTDGKWEVTARNGTTALLSQMEKLPLGIYDVSFIVRDLQGFGQMQTTTVRICQCINGECVERDRSVTLGPLGILTLLLPLLLLLLLCLLLFLYCTTKPEKLYLDEGGYSSGVLLPSNTEAPGDQVDSSFIKFPNTEFGHGQQGSLKGSLGWIARNSSSSMGVQNMPNEGFQLNSTLNKMNTHNLSSGQFDLYGQHVGSQVFGNVMDYGQRTLERNRAVGWNTNGLFIEKKLLEMDKSAADDVICSYGYEGAGSDVESLGCCSGYGEKEDLDFLDTLGPKFKRLADVCSKR